MYQPLIDFWFSDEVSKCWFNSTAKFDQQLFERYNDTWQLAQQDKYDHWCETALGSLALVILLDQFPLNMFRGQAKCFFTEAKSREVSRAAIDRGFDRDLSARQRSFLYMPFMHSEDLDDQAFALKLFDQPGLGDQLRYARHHYSIVEQFGRFPHRNKILGRKSTNDEVEYLNSKRGFKG